jgi:ferric-dicitrate binding protein FerR (iron transport regulator)
VRDGDNLGPEADELIRLARKNLGHLSDAQHERGLEAARGFPARRRAERRRRLLGLGGATSLTALALLLVGPRVLHRMNAGQTDSGPPLAYQVESGAIDGGGAIVARADEQAALRFGDGTVIRLGSETRGRLAEVDGHGAHVAIQNGSAHVSVVHKPQARWLIDAGPYQITVHGTVFSASWDEAQQRLDVKMERGLISVAGPVTNGPISVRGGQALTVKLKRSQVLLRDLDRDDVVADVDADTDGDAKTAVKAPAEDEGAAAVATAAPARARIAAKTAHVSSVKGRSWTAALSAGDFDSILDEAEHDLGRVLATRGTEDLAALADAARYRRHDEVARRALLAQRRRFPSSPRAADAAFFLGRLDENGGRGHGPALAWYERYLDEAPRGSYVAEALGRKMIAVQELQGADAARSVAEQYVRQFPHGSYAGAAHALCVDGARLRRAQSVAGGIGDPARVPMSTGAR